MRRSHVDRGVVYLDTDLKRTLGNLTFPWTFHDVRGLLYASRAGYYPLGTGYHPDISYFQRRTAGLARIFEYVNGAPVNFRESSNVRVTATNHPLLPVTSEKCFNIVSKKLCRRLCRRYERRVTNLRPNRGKCFWMKCTGIRKHVSLLFKVLFNIKLWNLYFPNSYYFIIFIFNNINMWRSEKFTTEFYSLHCHFTYFIHCCRVSDRSRKRRSSM